MKKMKHNLVAGVIAFTAMAGFIIPSAYAEVSASVGAANMYYWRGLDLGNGDASIWGDLKISESGFYAGVWAGSGDAALGQEYDLYAGYGGEVSEFRYDLSVWTYSYPSAAEPVSPGDLVEVIGSVGFGPFTFTYYEGLEDLEDYNYMTASAVFGSFTLKYGQHESDLSHLDLIYAFNDKLSFTLGKVLDDAEQGEEGDIDYVAGANDELKFVVGFTLPIE